MRKKAAKPYVPRNNGPDHFIFKGFFAHIPRREYALQKHALASKLGLTPRDLDRLLCGQEEPNEEQLLAIARHFKLSLEDLFVFPAPTAPPLVQEIAKAVAEKKQPLTDAAKESLVKNLPPLDVLPIPPAITHASEKPTTKGRQKGKTKSKKSTITLSKNT